MYMRRMMEIGQAENGYIVELHARIKPKKKGKMSDCVCAYPGSTEKQLIAKNAEELAEIIQKLMPLLDEEFSSEEEFEGAFEKASK